MAGTVTVSRKGSGMLKAIILTCVGDAANGSFPDTLLPLFEGRLMAVETNPATPAPTDLWDLSLEDPHGLNRLGSSGADQGTTLSKRTALKEVVSAQEQLTAKISGNSVNSAQLVIEIWYGPITAAGVA